MAVGSTLHLGYVLDSDEDDSVCEPANSSRVKICDTASCKLEQKSCGSSLQSKEPALTEVTCKFPDLAATSAPLHDTHRTPIATPARGRKRTSPSLDDSDIIAKACEENSGESAETFQPSTYPEEGYALRDLRRIISAMLPRYRHLLSSDEDEALSGFAHLSMPGQKLYARLLGRKWPQWIRLDGLGERYKELGGSETKAAIAELAAAPCSEPLDLTGPTQQSLSSELAFDGLELPNEPSTRACAPVAPWLLDSTCETVASLLSRPLQKPGMCPTSNADSFGTLLLEAQPMADLRQFARSLGVSGVTQGRQGSKAQLLSRLCDAARRQRMLSHRTDSSKVAHHPSSSTEARLVERVLQNGHWICVAPTPGRTAMSLLTDLFHMEASGVAESSYLVFSTRWPDYSFEPGKTVPLFMDRGALDLFLLARRFVVRLEQVQEKPAAEQFELDAKFAETELCKALDVARGNLFEAAKFDHPFRRRFTTAWYWAEALHSAVMHAPAAKDDSSRRIKIRQLRTLLDSGLCVSRRGQWYNELAKEVARADGAQAALQIAAEGIAEGEGKPIAARIMVDLVAEASSQEADSCVSEKEYPCIRQDLRWDLARRSRVLALSAGGVKRGGKKNWQYWLRNTHAAQAKAVGTDDGGRWLPALVSRLIAEETAAPGPVRCIPCTFVGLPSARVNKGTRRYDSFDLRELNVEELAMTYYFREMGFDCGIHCEGALLRDLFGIILFAEIFEPSVEGVFMSAYQDAPLDLGTEVFYSVRRIAIEKRLTTLAGLSSSELLAEVNTSFERLHGTRIRGVRWDRYQGPNARLQRKQNTLDEGNAEKQAERSISSHELRVRSDDVADESHSLGAVAGAIGGTVLAAAFRLLCLEYNSAGLPDLLLWSFVEGHSPRARFVEVKSENDSLSRRQRLWLATLRSAGAEAEVCHVRDVPSQEASQ